MILGTTKDRRTLAYLAPSNSAIANELLVNLTRAPTAGLFLEITLPVGSNQNQLDVLAALRLIHAGGFHPSQKIGSDGIARPYAARNGGGYTLEALLGIPPNSKAEPDYLGWEIKSFSSSNRVTLMTPEPDGGFYRKYGAKAFVERYGHDVKNGGMYFTGVHRVGIPCLATGMTMHVDGFDAVTRKLRDVGGAVWLMDAAGNEAASWAFADLLTHWNLKHAFAAYIPYTAQPAPLVYRYDTPILMGEHTDFGKYLFALCSGAVVFDPGTKVIDARTSQSKVKARSQFRVNIRDLGLLYETVTAHSITPMA